MKLQKAIADYVYNNGIKQAFISEKTGIKRCTLNSILKLKRRMFADEFLLVCIALGKDANFFVELAEKME